jgi:hypothetical protein
MLLLQAQLAAEGAGRDSSNTPSHTMMAAMQSSLYVSTASPSPVTGSVQGAARG